MKQLVLMLLGIVIISCSNNPAPKPNVLLKDEIMKDIMFDVAVLQAAESTMPSRLASNNIKVNTYIYEKYKIDSLTFYQNQKYYAADPKKYKKMHEQVLERLEKMQEELEPAVKPVEEKQPEVK